jgi:predicted  nucleic acid-binding Zn-ribbon protein
VTEELRVHWELHETDEQSVSREQQLARHPELRRAHEAKVAAARAVLAAIDQRLATALQRRRALERDITAFDVQQKRFDQQLLAVTDQKQYLAVQHEIAAVRAKRDTLETEALELLDQEERESKVRPEKAHVLERAESEARAAFEALESEGVKLRGELAALEAERQRVCAQLPPASRQRYERLRSGRSGRAVAAIDHNACGACHRGLPPAGLQAARRRDALLVCDGCGRLMLLPPEASSPA